MFARATKNIFVQKMDVSMAGRNTQHMNGDKEAFLKLLLFSHSFSVLVGPQSSSKPTAKIKRTQKQEDA